MSGRRRLRPLWGSALIGMVLVVSTALEIALGSTSSNRTFVVFLVNVMLVLSIQAFIGNSGIVSFGHVAFMGIGAYTTALLTIPSTIKLAQLTCRRPSRTRTSACCRRSRSRHSRRWSWPRSSAEPSSA